jgi:hypothetical protein
MRRLFPLCGFSLLLAIGCGGSGEVDSGDDPGAGGSNAAGAPSTDGGNGTGGGSGGGADCAEIGSGTLILDVVGLPDGVEPDLTFEGPGSSVVHEAGAYEDLVSGSYTVTAERVTEDDPIVRTVYEATISESEVCIEDGGTQTVTVEYAPIPSSNKLWMASGAETELAGFSSADLAETAALDATVGIDGPGGKEVAFDGDGNLWAFGPTVADPLLVRFDAADLGESGELEASIGIGVPQIECLPALRSMAFDAAGNLWLSACGEQIVRLPASALSATADDVEADVVLSGLVGNQGIAFDGAGNLWVADDGLLARYDEERLQASNSDPADLVLTVSDASDSQVLGATRLAFDRAGNLWASDFGSNYVFMVPAAALEGSGNDALAADVSIAIDVLALLEGMAFDESDALWLTLDEGRFGKLTAEQLGTSSTAGDPTVPEVIIQSSSVGSTSGLAFFPAPAGLPLLQALP